MSRLFLSYRRADCPGSVARLYEGLRQHLPQWTIFYDHETLRAGQAFPEGLRKAVSEADVVLVLIGPRWLPLLAERSRANELDHVREEVRLALKANRTVVPVAMERASFPSDADLAPYPDIVPLASRNGMGIRPDPDFHADLQRMIAFLDALGPGVGPGTVLAGRYKILRVIGQGGMGIVFEAQDVSIRTSDARVAIKMILEGMDTKQVLARFDGEKEALARFDHPNIAGIIGSGVTPGGRPYFVMEYIRGEPITEYCDRKKLDPKTRVDLFRDVCKAIQHAHQKGIIHRDLKPSNVLVEEIDGRATPIVIDFGLAKALGGRLTDKTLFTEHGRTVGTLLYSSPEQAAGRGYEVDTRTDIYSLGAMLYELLTGDPPFSQAQLDNAGIEAKLRMILDEEPSRPSVKLSSSPSLPVIAANRRVLPDALTRQVRGELDWIVMKALEKESSRRYESASQFADDLQRFLSNEPVQAMPPSNWYLLQKFARRNIGKIIVGASAAVLVLIGILGTGWGLLEANYQAGRALRAASEKTVALEQRNVALVESATNRELAEKRLEEKIDALDRLIESLSDEELKGLPGSQPVRRLFLDKGILQYRSLVRESESNEKTAVSLIDTLKELSRLEEELGHDAAAEIAIRDAVEQARALLKQLPDNREAQLRLCRGINDLGGSLVSLGRNGEAMQLLEEARELGTHIATNHSNDAETLATLGRNWNQITMAATSDELVSDTTKQGIECLRKATELRPDDASILSELGRSIRNRSTIMTSPETIDDRLAGYQEALDLQTRAVTLDPNSGLFRYRQSAAISSLVHQYRLRGAQQAAINLVDRFLPEAESFATKNPASSYGVQAYAELREDRAYSLMDLERIKDSEKEFRLSLEGFNALAKVLPSNTEIHQRLAFAHRRIAECMVKRGQTQSAVAEYRAGMNVLFRAVDQCERCDSLVQEMMEALPGLREQMRLLDQRDEVPKLLESVAESISRALQRERIAKELTATELFKVFGDYLVQHPDEKVLPATESLLREMDDALARLAKEDSALTVRRFLYRSALANWLKRRGEAADAAAILSALVDQAPELPLAKARMEFRLECYAWWHLAQLAECYGAANEPQREYETLRRYFQEADRYFGRSDRSKLLAQTKEYSAGTLEQLRLALDEELEWRRLEKYNVYDVRWNNQPISLHLSDSWDLIELQTNYWRDIHEANFEKSVNFQLLRRIFEEMQNIPRGFFRCASFASKDTRAVAVDQAIERARARCRDEQNGIPSQLALARILLEKARMQTSSIAKERIPGLMEEVQSILDNLREVAPEYSSQWNALYSRFWLVRAREKEVESGPMATRRQYLLQSWDHCQRNDESLLKREILLSLGHSSPSLHESVAWFCQAASSGELAAIEQICMRITPFNPELLAICTESVQRVMQDRIQPSNRLFEFQLRKSLMEWYDEQVIPSLPKATTTSSETSNDATEDLQVTLSEEDQAIFERFGDIYGVEYQRVINVLYGILQDGNPFWVFVAIKKNRFTDFKEAQERGKIDLEKFEPWGELIISGEGVSPPLDVVARVANMYQTDAEKLAKNLDDFQTKERPSVPEGPNQPSGDEPKPATKWTEEETRFMKTPEVDWIRFPETKLKELLPKRVLYFAEQSDVEEVTRCADALASREQFLEAAVAYAEADRLTKRTRREKANETEPLGNESLIKASLECLERLVADPAFSDFAELATNAKLQALHDTSKFKQLFRLR